MHFYYAFLERSLECYNKDNTSSTNISLMINAITLSKVLAREKDDAFFSLVNPLYKQALTLKMQGKDSFKVNMELNKLINRSRDCVSRMMSELSKFQRVTMATEMHQRKMSWDTFAAQVSD